VGSKRRCGGGGRTELHNSQSVGGSGDGLSDHQIVRAEIYFTVHID